MATATSTTSPARPRPYRLSVDQYLRMIAAGVFPPDARAELLGGLLIEQMTKGDPHDYALDALADLLRRSIPAGWLLREDKSLQLSRRSRPEPDIAIVRGPREQYARRTPHARETALVVGVAASSYDIDRGIKWHAYAAARVPIYWIVHLGQRRVEVYTDPTGRGRSASYQAVQLFDATATVPVVIAGVEVGRVAVAAILP